jgi:hypothetical protein
MSNDTRKAVAELPAPMLILELEFHAHGLV